MRRQNYFLLLITALVLQSCKFSCTVGDKPPIDHKEDNRNGRIRNEISIRSENIKVDKAYLVFEDGEPVPADNVVDFSKPVNLIVVLDSGWKSMNGKVHLGAGEKIVVENGRTLLDENDLFANAPEGLTEKDSKTIILTAIINVTKDIRPLTTFIVSFDIWDKNSDAYVKGNYKLYAK